MVRYHVAPNLLNVLFQAAAGEREEFPALKLCPGRVNPSELISETRLVWMKGVVSVATLAACFVSSKKRVMTSIIQGLEYGDCVAPRHCWFLIHVRAFSIFHSGKRSYYNDSLSS
jgi:hypothetical protein